MNDNIILILLVNYHPDCSREHLWIFCFTRSIVLGKGIIVSFFGRAPARLCAFISNIFQTETKF